MITVFWPRAMTWVTRHFWPRVPDRYMLWHLAGFVVWYCWQLWKLCIWLLLLLLVSAAQLLTLVLEGLAAPFRIWWASKHPVPVDGRIYEDWLE